MYILLCKYINTIKSMDFIYVKKKKKMETGISYMNQQNLDFQKKSRWINVRCTLTICLNN